MTPVNPRLRGFVPLVHGLAEMFGPDCEVVLHDLAAMPRSIVAIENGHVTGRRVGDVPTDRMLRSLREANEGADDVRLYLSSQEGRILRSLAVTLRDPDGRQIGVLGVNLDISEMVHAQRTLNAFTAVGRASGETAAEAHEIFAHDIREVLAGMIAAILAEMGKTPATMTRDDKREVVKRLDERGAFLVKRSAEQVAEALDLSRYTIFSYLKEIRHHNGDSRHHALVTGATEC
ncbi:MAG TPA: helix-turn-helix transcriptional regulator [Thermoleophilia bacterium]|nr:helix-turn-helix transcriptional regulator [Thermoleophilia bacterium]